MMFIVIFHIRGFYTSASVFLWHYPRIYFLMILFRILGLNSGRFLYMIVQLFIIICVSAISSYIFEPRLNKYAVNKKRNMIRFKM